MILPRQDALELMGQSEAFDVNFYHDSVEREIINYIGWNPESTTYTNIVVDGTGGQRIWPGHKNITSLIRVAISMESAINIKHTAASSNAYARINYTDNIGVSLQLVVADGTAVSDVTELFSSSATLTALVTYINTQSGNGWSAELFGSNFGILASTTLIEVDNIYAGTEDGTDPGFVVLQRVGKPTRDVKVERTEGGLYRSSGWPPGVQNIAFTYTAGWTTADMPGDLKQAVIQLMKFFFTRHQQDAEGIKSFSLRNLKIEYATTNDTESKSSIPISVLDVLDTRYRIDSIV